MERLTFDVPKMDCGAEEQLIRMRLGDRSDVRRVTCDLGNRTVEIVHVGDAAEIERELQSLKLGASLVGTSAIEELEPEATDEVQRRTLAWVLAINAAFFLIELAVGFLAGSMGLIADSLDMLADAIVYGLVLFAVGRAHRVKQNVAKVSGWSQLALAGLGIAEVLRRFLGAEIEPLSAWMIGTSALALAGNVTSLILLQRSRSREVHIRATTICTSNDVLVNLGVIVAGVLVFLTASKIPDLVVGAIVFALVGFAAVRILRIAR